MHFVARLERQGRRTLIEFPDCAGCQTFAEPDEDPLGVAREALEGWLESHLVGGDAPPRPRARRRVAGGVAVAIDPVLATRLQIRWIRQERGLSQAQLAAVLGVSRQQVSLLESPDGDYKISTLRRVAEALGVELAIELRRGAA